jgi:hypothetical protein
MVAAIVVRKSGFGQVPARGIQLYAVARVKALAKVAIGRILLTGRTDNFIQVVRIWTARSSDRLHSRKLAPSREDVAKSVKVPAEYLGNIRPARMLMVVDGHIKPEYLIDVDTVAAAA